MRKFASFMWLLFLSVFATSKMLANVEEELAILTGEKEKQAPNNEGPNPEAAKK